MKIVKVVLELDDGTELTVDYPEILMDDLQENLDERRIPLCVTKAITSTRKDEKDVLFVDLLYGEGK